MELIYKSESGVQQIDETGRVHGDHEAKPDASCTELIKRGARSLFGNSVVFLFIFLSALALGYFSECIRAVRVLKCSLQ